MSHPHTKDWSETCVYADPCVGTTRRAVLKLEETLTEEVEKLAEKGIRIAHHSTSALILCFHQFYVRLVVTMKTYEKKIICTECALVVYFRS